MELDNCSVCFNEYHEETYVPKISKCGHSFCEKCLTSILQSQKSCPKCRATLSRNIEEYPTNFDLLTLSQCSKGKSRVDFEDPYSLESMKNELNRQKKILKELMAEIDSIAGSLDRNKVQKVESTKASTQKLLSCAKIMFEPDEIADLVQDIEECLEEVNKSLHYSLGTHKDLLRLKDFENSKQYLTKIAHQLQNGKRVYACKRTDDLEEWKYGEVTCSENLLHIHCLSPSGFEPGASLVLFKDVKDCITSSEDILPFIEFGCQKLRFTLTDDSPFHALRFLKFCTGEEGSTIKGRDSGVGKCESENLNYCVIDIPTEERLRGYEDALYQKKWCEAKKGEVTLECGFNRVSITKWPKDENFLNLVGKLHENFNIDFDQMEKEPKVTDSGISLVLSELINT